MNKPKVILDPYFREMDIIFSPNDKQQLYQTIDVIWGQDEPMPQDKFLEALPEAEAIVCGEWRYGDVLEKATQLRAIFVVSGAFPLELDYDYCYQHQIRVLSVAPAFARQVAEMCLGMALDSCREIAAGDRAMRSGTEIYLKDGNKNTFMLFDQPVGIIGYGSIARALHPLLVPFNVTISVYDPWLGDRYLRQQGVESVSLDRLMSESRVIFVLAPPTTENQAMLSRKYLEMIRADAVLVLASRAHVVDFDTMTEMVLDKTI